MRWKEYNAEWLAKLVMQQHPDRPEVYKSLLAIKKYAEESRAYYYFVDPSNANMQGSQWQFKENLLINDSKLGELILDILENDKVGGVEILRYIS